MIAVRADAEAGEMFGRRGVEVAMAYSVWRRASRRAGEYATLRAGAVVTAHAARR